MFGLLNSSQIYGIQHEHEHINNISSNTSTTTTSTATIHKTYNNNNNKHRRSTSSASDAIKENKFFATFSSMQGIKSPTNFIEKFIKSELLNGYDTIKNYKNFQHSSANSTTTSTPNSHTSKQNTSGHNLHPDGILTSFNCLQGSYRSNCDGEFYEAVNVNNSLKTPQTSSIVCTATAQTTPRTTIAASKTPTEMTIKCSKNLLAEPTQIQAPATLQNYQKLPEDCDHDLHPTTNEMAVASTTSSGASSGEFNSDTPIAQTIGTSLYKKFSFGGRNSKNSDVAQVQSNEVPSDNSSSSISTSTTNSSKHNSITSSTSTKSSDLQRSSSASSSGDCATATTTTTERKKLTDGNAPSSCLTPERVQRRKLLQMISNYEQQNKFLQRELAKEKRRRTEELACVVKSLLCFEAKLKTDMKSVNQRLQDKDAEICRLVRQNRAIRKRLTEAKKLEQESTHDEGVVEDGDVETEPLLGPDNENENELMIDCLVLEALQCINCRKQFYDIDLKEGWTQTGMKDGSRNNDNHTTEHGSSSDDTTVSSSFYGARRSVRYTSKRTSGTFRDYMRSRSMNIDDPALDNNSEENTSTISRDDSQTSYEKLNMYSRTIERMHGVKCESSERESEQSGVEMPTRSGSRLSNKSVGSRSSNCGAGDNSDKTISSQNEEDDDGIFSPTQDDDFEEETECGNGDSNMVAVLREKQTSSADRSLKIVKRRSMEFSEASPKQVYETSTDDWYASASDQEEIGTSASKSYGHGAVNPVLECVNQILLQQSMEESIHERCSIPNKDVATTHKSQQPQLTPKTPSHLQVPTSLPRRSSLSGRRSSRSNSHSSDGQNSRNGTLTRKRVHFSTKNSMVHVPRNDDVDDDDEGQDDGLDSSLEGGSNKTISSLQQHYFPMNYCPSSPQPGDVESERGRLETLNYESIYSNEYEPIGSEHNAYNLYVDMESGNKSAQGQGKMTKMPPALPPKPANLLKFKKSLQQLDEVPDEHLQQDCTVMSTTANSEPDYCSISEVNVGITSVQIVADVHKAPPTDSEPDIEAQSVLAAESELELEVSTVVSDDTCAASQKTDEIEEIFADIPKLPNVAAIIAPKTAKYEQQQQQSDYLVMSPKVDPAISMKLTPQSATKLLPSGITSTPNTTNNNNNKEFLSTPSKSTKLETTPLKLQLLANNNASQYKRKHMPNILAEINKRMSQPNSPTATTPTKLTPTSKIKSLQTTPLLKQLENTTPNLPLQAEFDWYNLDAEYGRAPAPLTTVESLTGNKMLEEIHEDHESVVTAADEYNLDEEFSLNGEKSDDMTTTSTESNESHATFIEQTNAKNSMKLQNNAALNAAICEAVNFPLYNENTPHTQPHVAHAKAKKMKKNLANFEKFIEGSGLSTKPLPSKRKIYFAGPFV